MWVRGPYQRPLVKPPTRLPPLSRHVHTNPHTKHTVGDEHVARLLGRALRINLPCEHKRGGTSASLKWHTRPLGQCTHRSRLRTNTRSRVSKRPNGILGRRCSPLRSRPRKWLKYVCLRACTPRIVSGALKGDGGDEWQYFRIKLMLSASMHTAHCEWRVERRWGAMSGSDFTHCRVAALLDVAHLLRQRNEFSGLQKGNGSSKSVSHYSQTGPRPVGHARCAGRARRTRRAA